MKHKILIATVSSLILFVTTFSYTVAHAQSSIGSMGLTKAKSNKSKKAPKVAEPVDWIKKASDELLGAKTTEGVLPTPATVVAVANSHESAIERTALRVGLTFEPYQPRGTGTFGVGESINYDTLPSSVLGNADLRWLPFVLDENQKVIAGGYIAFGYSRSNLPLVTPTGFKYDDVALNSMRFEAGAAVGGKIYGNWSAEGKLGLGRQSYVQTSRYSEVVGNFDRPYVAAAVDLQYHLLPKLALVGSLAKRSPIAEGSGSIGFAPLTVSGGLLVQVR